jgi:hypothetical protein
MGGAQSTSGIGGASASGTGGAGGSSTTGTGGSPPFVSGWDPRPGLLGLDNLASGLFIDPTTVVVGGAFLHAGGAPAHFLTRFDPATGTFAAIPNALGNPGSVTRLARFQGQLIAAGAFPGGLAGEVPGGFALLSGGLIDPGLAFALDAEPSQLWVGGSFVTSDHSAASVVGWNGGWNPLSNDPGFVVESIAADGGTLWVGGDFIASLGVPLQDYYGIGRYDLPSGKWSPLGTGATGGHRANGRASVSAIVPTADFVYAGGDFSAMNGVAAQSLARFRRSTATWEPVPPGPGVNGGVTSMVFDQGKLYIAGLFGQVGGILASNVAVFDEAAGTWSDIGGGVDGMFIGYPPQALNIAVQGKDIYVTGNFASAGGLPSAGFAHWRSP